MIGMSRPSAFMNGPLPPLLPEDGCPEKPEGERQQLLLERDGPNSIAERRARLA